MPTIQCIRQQCIEDPDDPYHEETHTCFVCGEEFEPTPELLEEVCEVCGWYKCPHCGGCKCSLSKYDQSWLDVLREKFCTDASMMAFLDVNTLPQTDNPHLLEGMTRQLEHCVEWARNHWP